MKPEPQDYLLESYDYYLPAERIAQKALEDRQSSRLLRLDKQTGALSHGVFTDLLGLLRPGDLLVANNTRVVKARLLGNKETGGKAEVFVLDPASFLLKTDEGESLITHCLVKAAKAPRPGTKILFPKGFGATVVGRDGREFLLDFGPNVDGFAMLEEIGQVPLPPYVQRPGGADSGDEVSYQTVYAQKDGAVAAPTAGLHFTPELLSRLEQKGVERASLTLHVGFGTFAPVHEKDARDHKLHAEWYALDAQAAKAVNRAKKQGRRVVAVGTTSVRTLEYCARSQTEKAGEGANGEEVVEASQGWCDLFIMPGFDFRVVDALITNFHLPQSTLLMLVSALAGRQNILAAYRRAVEMEYRFYSFGDAMFIS